jgi:hypothetical protein
MGLLIVMEDWMNEIYWLVVIISMSNVGLIFIAVIKNAYLIVFIVYNDVQIRQILYYVISYKLFGIQLVNTLHANIFVPVVTSDVIYLDSAAIIVIQLEKVNNTFS